MAKYRITIVSTDIYEADVEADNLIEAKVTAICDSSNWILSEPDSTSDVGQDHKVWDETTNRWIEAKGGE
jgi:hypothetical protein